MDGSSLNNMLLMKNADASAQVQHVHVLQGALVVQA